MHFIANCPTNQCTCETPVSVISFPTQYMISDGCYNPCDQSFYILLPTHCQNREHNRRLTAEVSTDQKFRPAHTFPVHRRYPETFDSLDYGNNELHYIPYSLASSRGDILIYNKSMLPMVHYHGGYIRPLTSQSLH